MVDTPSTASVTLPSWLIIGTPKSGTTTLADLLRSHPGAYVPANKELEFFDRLFERGLGWYSAHFAGAGPDQRPGEATPTYLYADAAMQRIADCLPDAKLAVVLREPARRAWSHAWYFRMLGLERRDPAVALEHELDRQDVEAPIRYLHMSRYVEHLERVVDAVGRSRLLVLFTEELQSDRTATLFRLLDHFDLDRLDLAPARSNPGGVPRSFWVQRTLLRVGRRLPASRTRNRVIISLMRANRRRGYPSIPADLEQRLRDSFASDNEDLASWLGRELPSNWSTTARR